MLCELDPSKSEGEQGDNSEYRDHSEQRDQRAARNFKSKRMSQCLQGKMENAYS